MHKPLITNRMVESNPGYKANAIVETALGSKPYSINLPTIERTATKAELEKILHHTALDINEDLQHYSGGNPW